MKNDIPKGKSSKRGYYSYMPEYGWGGIISGGLSGLGTGATIGSAFPVYGTAIGAGIGLVAGAIYGGVSEDDAEKEKQKQQEDNLMAVRHSGLYGGNGQGNQLGVQPAKMAYGGGIGMSPANVEGGEILTTPQGYSQKMSGPSHANGGINTVAPKGTQVLSDRIKNPETGRTFAEDGAKASLILEKANKVLKLVEEGKTVVPADMRRSYTIAATNAKRELDNIYAKQEAYKQQVQSNLQMMAQQKMMSGDDSPIDVPNWIDNPEEQITNPASQSVQQFRYGGMYGSDNPWEKKTNESTAPVGDPGYIEPDPNFDIKQRLYKGAENTTTLTGPSQNNFRDYDWYEETDGYYNPAFPVKRRDPGAIYPDPTSGPEAPVTNDPTLPKGNDGQQRWSTEPGAKTPSDIMINPESANKMNPNAGYIEDLKNKDAKSPMQTYSPDGYKGSGESWFTKNKSTIGNVAGIAGELAPIAYNLLQKKPDKWDVREYMVNRRLSPQRYDVSAQLKQAERTYAALVNDTRLTPSERAAVANNLNQAKAQIMSAQQNQYMQDVARTDQINLNIDANNARTAMAVRDSSDKDFAAYKNMQAAAYGQISDAVQNRKLMQNQIERDNKLIALTGQTFANFTLDEKGNWAVRKNGALVPVVDPRVLQILTSQ